MPDTKYLNIADVANLAGVGKRAARKAAAKGRLNAFQDENGHWFTTREAAMEWATNRGVDLPKSKEDAVLTLGKHRFDPNTEVKEDSLRSDLIEKENQIRKYRTLIKQYESAASLEDRIERTIVDSLRNNPYSPRIQVKDTDLSGDSDARDYEMLLLISDAHYPEIVNPEEALGIAYNPDICMARLKHITETTIRLKKWKRYGVRKLTVGVLGDMLSGNIHEELELSNSVPMSQAVTDMGYAMADVLFELSHHFEEIDAIFMPGNHPRLNKKPRHKHKWDNFEYIMAQITKAIVSIDKSITVTAPKDLIYTHRIFDMNVGMLHGDGSKAASFAGIPFYGSKQRSTANQSMRSMLGLDRHNMLVMGHFHQQLNWTEGDCHIFLNGAIKGGDEYGIVGRSSATDPVQCLLTFNKDNGWINTERIPLQHIT